jgi:DNA-binding NarL/FixJ family response regulator
MAIKVILADDHAVVRDGLRMMLESQAGFAVVGETGNGREAVNLSRDLKPDVAVIDIAMPGLNGIEAARQIRAQGPATQVVILSMYATAEHVYQALQAGVLGYVLKEAAGQEVADAIRTVATGRRYLSGKIEQTIIDHYLGQTQGLAEPSPLDRLSGREREVLQLVVEGQSSKAIAAVMHLSPKTVDTYRHRIMQKLAVHDLAGLIRFAMEHGLAPPG